jgi:sulfotransferase family protein
VNVDEIICAAQRRSGIEELHTDSFHEGLEVLVDAVESAPLTPQQEARLFAETRRAVVNRLVIDDWWHRHPSVDVDVPRPVFVIGMPRTGTTALVNLLAQDLERCRVLWHWEIDDPVPPAAPDRLLDDPRIAAKTAKLAPVVEALANFPHLERATDPVECVHVLAQDFKSLTWHTSTGSSRYNEWFLDRADLRSAYAHHRRTLQVLQSNGAGGQWVLKLPSHALHLEALLSVYPDARLVITHRDPLKALVSMCSFAAMIHDVNGNQVELTELIAATRRQVVESALRSAEFVSRHPEVDVYHIHQDQLAADPVGHVNALRSWIGLPVDGHLDQRMRRYLDEDWHHPPGSHRYRAKDFGITRTSVNDEFEPYLRQFDIPLESQ